MTDRNDRPRRARALGRLRSVLDRYGRACAKMNEHLAALAVALAIIVTLTAACRAPALLADHAGATQIQD
jgi:hypothetical protein